MTVAPGARFLEWDAEQLRRMMLKSDKLGIALQAQFNADLVRKVSAGMPVPR